MKKSALAGILVAIAIPAPAAAAEVLPAGAGGALAHGTVLSDEERLTRWAHVFAEARIRARPSRRAKTVGRLRFQTEDRLPEVYVALKVARDSKRRAWIQVRIPARPNGRKGWVPRSALSDFKLVRTRLLLDKGRLKAILYKNGRKIWSSRVGIGAPGTPTPSGHFWIRERIRNLGGGGPYGPWAFGTAAYSALSDWPGGGVVGIHGTDQPQLIPGRPSHGCIRVPNRKVIRLAKLLPIGTPLEITE